MTTKSIIWIFIIFILVILSICAVILMKLDDSFKKNQMMSVETSDTHIELSEVKETNNKEEKQNEENVYTYNINEIYDGLQAWFPNCYYSETHDCIRVPMFTEDGVCYVYCLINDKTNMIDIKLNDDKKDDKSTLSSILNRDDVSMEIRDCICEDIFSYLVSNCTFESFTEESLQSDW